MKDLHGFIDDFITIETKFKSNSNNSFETSEYTGVQDFFETHFSESYSTDEGLKLYKIDVYKIKIGDIIKLHPSKWAIESSEKHNLQQTDTYDFNYEVIDMEISLYSRNPKSDSEIPKLKIDIYLKRK